MPFSNDWSRCRPWRKQFDRYGAVCYGEAAGGWRAGSGLANRDTYNPDNNCNPGSDYKGPNSVAWCSWNNATGQGSVTRRIQSQLNIAREAFGLPFARLTVDGILGSKSHAAIVAYQRWANLKPDGIVGVGTWAKLSAYI